MLINCKINCNEQKDRGLYDQCVEWRHILKEQENAIEEAKISASQVDINISQTSLNDDAFD
jgi:hypothetical protein